MSRPITAHPDASSERLEDLTRLWGGRRWGRLLFPGFWLIYLAQAGTGISEHSSGWSAIVGYLLLVAFAGCYLAALWQVWERNTRLFWPLYAALVAITVVVVVLGGQPALMMCVYIAVVTIASRSRFTLQLVITLVVLTAVAPLLVPSWGGTVDVGDAVTVALISIAMWGFFKVIESNIALTAARAEVARLAAENERSRIARDLHDLLGHSLTTVTVKSGLARRLAERGDAERAAQEIAEVESISRRTMSEVRAAVAGYRDVTLGGELSSARTVLRAAGIEADLPGSVDIVDADGVEVFGWVLREGVTNMVRHSRAAHCRITLGPRWIEIADDGHGGGAACDGGGNGLRGLRERVEALGGTLTAQGGPDGWRLRAELAPLSMPSDATTIDA